ncbi:MAG: hypothetical protein HeimC3_15280 [Candidatus Heimdallarchaeota archaeon LC_3]|nr:MAG: hypothetical protein HeimC3_15280 [Candidatus Heimdallarchaeota archaeon LC_3]
MIGKEKFYQNYFKKIRRFSEEDKRVLKIKLSDRIDNIKEYMLFATKEKIETYIWESCKYLDICNDFFLETDLIPVLYKELKSLKSLNRE